MKNKKEYLKPEITIIEFNAKDIILTSDIGDIIDESDTPNLPGGGQ